MPNNITRIDVFAELTSPMGTFDYERCCSILGENYDSFVRLCDAAKLIPEEIEKIDMQEVHRKNHDDKHVVYELTLVTGKTMKFEA